MIKPVNDFKKMVGVNFHPKRNVILNKGNKHTHRNTDTSLPRKSQKQHC